MSYADHRGPVVSHLSLELPPGAIVGLVGPAGCGKTTLLTLLAGRRAPDTGEVRYGAATHVAYCTRRELLSQTDRTVWDLLAHGQAFITIGSGREVASRAYLSAFGFHGHTQGARVSELTDAEKDRLVLAATCRLGGNLLLLDDPTGGLEIEMLTGLEDALLNFAGSAIIATHDRWLLARTATHILEWNGDSTQPGRWNWRNDGYAG